MATTGSNIEPKMRAKGMPVRFRRAEEGAPR